MTGKYIDLAGRISGSDSYNSDDRRVILDVLDWLDEHPDQVPGRTITESELEVAVSETRLASCGVHPRQFLSRLGITVVPDPEPTNAERLRADLEEMNGDGFLLANRHKALIVERLIEHGWVKAPKGDES